MHSAGSFQVQSCQQPLLESMATGAEHGFFGPTNTNKIAGAQRHTFLTHPSETIQRLLLTSIDPTMPAKDDGHPSQGALDTIGDISFVRPIDFFNLIITPRFVEKTKVACTNQKAAGAGAGTGGIVYTDYVQFDVDDCTALLEFSMLMDLHQSSMLQSGLSLLHLMNCWVMPLKVVPAI